MRVDMCVDMCVGLRIDMFQVCAMGCREALVETVLKAAGTVTPVLWAMSMRISKLELRCPGSQTKMT